MYFWCAAVAYYFNVTSYMQLIIHSKYYLKIFDEAKLFNNHILYR